MGQQLLTKLTGEQTVELFDVPVGRDLQGVKGQLSPSELADQKRFDKKTGMTHGLDAAKENHHCKAYDVRKGKDYCAEWHKQQEGKKCKRWETLYKGKKCLKQENRQKTIKYKVKEQREKPNPAHAVWRTKLNKDEKEVVDYEKKRAAELAKMKAEEKKRIEDERKKKEEFMKKMFEANTMRVRSSRKKAVSDYEKEVARIKKDIADRSLAAEEAHNKKHANDSKILADKFNAFAANVKNSKNKVAAHRDAVIRNIAKWVQGKVAAIEAWYKRHYEIKQAHQAEKNADLHFARWDTKKQNTIKAIEEKYQMTKAEIKKNTDVEWDVAHKAGKADHPWKTAFYAARKNKYDIVRRHYLSALAALDKLKYKGPRDEVKKAELEAFMKKYRAMGDRKKAAQIAAVKKQGEVNTLKVKAQANHALALRDKKHAAGFRAKEARQNALRQALEKSKAASKAAFDKELADKLAALKAKHDKVKAQKEAELLKLQKNLEAETAAANVVVRSSRKKAADKWDLFDKETKAGVAKRRDAIAKHKAAQPNPIIIYHVDVPKERIEKYTVCTKEITGYDKTVKKYKCVPIDPYSIIIDKCEVQAVQKGKIVCTKKVEVQPSLVCLKYEIDKEKNTMKCVQKKKMLPKEHCLKKFKFKGEEFCGESKVLPPKTFCVEYILKDAKDAKGRAIKKRECTKKVEFFGKTETDFQCEKYTKIVESHDANGKPVQKEACMRYKDLTALDLNSGFGDMDFGGDMNFGGDMGGDFSFRARVLKVAVSNSESVRNSLHLFKRRDQRLLAKCF